MNADGRVWLQALKDETDKDKRTELIEETNRCAAYAQLDREVNEGVLHLLAGRAKHPYETGLIHLLSRILDELS